MTFEDMWKSLEEKDTTGKYKQAREMSDLSIEQLEYAYNSGYADAKSEYERPQGMWVDHSCYKDVIICSNCNSGDSRWHKDFKFCPNCGSEMRVGAKMTNKEAIKYLVAPVATSTEPSAEYLKQKEAYELAIRALETLNGIKHKVYRNEMCDSAGRCYNYFGYHCAGCNGSKMNGGTKNDK